MPDRGGPKKADEPQPTVRVSVESGILLASAMGAAGALNTALASFLLSEPSVREDHAELTRVRNAGVWAITTAYEASDSDQVLDLDLVAAAALDTVRDALWLAHRALEVVRRRDVGPWSEAEVERLAGTIEAIAELVPGRGSGAGSGPGEPTAQEPGGT